MRNAKNYRKISYTRETVSPHRKRGHQDYCAGRGYPREYETWEPWEQRNYERGRAVAAALTGMGHTVPAWKDSVSLPRGYKELAAAAAQWAKSGSF